MGYTDVILVFVIGLIGTIVIVISIGGMVIRKLLEPKRELVQRIETLEKEIQALKNKK